MPAMLHTHSIDVYRDAIAELLTAWDSLEKYEPRPADELTALAVFPLVARSFDMAEAAVYLWDAGFYIPSMPNVRACFEAAVQAAWLQQTGRPAVKAYLYERCRQTQGMLRALDNLDVVTDEVRTALATNPLLLAQAPDHADAARHMGIACRTLDGGDGLYVTYRQISDEGHASIALLRYLVRSPTGHLVAVKSARVSDDTPVAAASVVSQSLVWAAAAVSAIAVSKPFGQVVEAVAARLGLPPLLVRTEQRAA